MRRLFVLILSFWPLTSSAGVDEVLDAHVLPGMARFAEASRDLAYAAERECSAAALRPAWNSAFDAWLGVAHLRLGPMETDGRALAIAFWPDTRGMVPRTVARLVSEEDVALLSEQALAEVSVAGRGFFALEYLLYDPQFAGYGPESYSCALVRAMTADLECMAAEISVGWREGFAEAMRSAGAPGNTDFLSPREPLQAFYTALMTGLAFNAEQRLGRPLGTFERPRPNRAEARRSGRSLRNVVFSLEALHELAKPLANSPIPRTDIAFADAIDQMYRLEDPSFAGVGDPSDRLKIEIVQQRIRLIRDAVAGEIGVALGVSAGFNSADGD